MKINDSYSVDQIESVGLKEKEVEDLQASIYTKDHKVYFFEPVGDERLRLYSIINERSFFL